jgi:hypothetical protein
MTSSHRKPSSKQQIGLVLIQITWLSESSIGVCWSPLGLPGHFTNCTRCRKYGDYSPYYWRTQISLLFSSRSSSSWAATSSLWFHPQPLLLTDLDFTISASFLVDKACNLSRVSCDRTESSPLLCWRGGRQPLPAVLSSKRRVLCGSSVST